MATKKSAVILDGKALADKIKLDLRKKIIAANQTPGLAAVLVGDDPASKIYIQLKEKACLEVGLSFHKYLCNQDCYPNISEAELISLIKFLNQDPETNGIIIQLPLPKKFGAEKIIKAISPLKDVDGFHPQNKNSQIIPPTVAAVSELLSNTNEKLSDKSTLIIGKSNVFLQGLKKNLKKNLKIKKIKTSTTLPTDSQNFDIIIIALGQALALKKSMVKPGAIVIDVGINRKNGQIVGDVDPKVIEVAGWVSPVPGGVGPLTVACLLKNTFLLSRK
ncbi:MAG: bifunctional 5,10-methylenetetrahydrofolate dehydrogenase/5,10-methenyltetrahydrofolate cyclohydrolase [Patescibacteria group bacterium]